MKCPYCEQEIEDGSTVCSICGKALSIDTNAEPAEAAGQESLAPENPIQENPLPESSLPENQEPKKNSKKTLWIAAAVAAAGIIAVGVFAMPKKSGKDIVIDAFKSIVAKEQTDPMEEIFGWEEMNKKLNTEPSEVNLELQFQESSDETLNQLVTGKIGMSAMNDPANKKMSAVFGVGYGDMNVANLEFYLDDKQFVAAIPELSEKAFSLNYAEDLEGQIENSPFFGELFAESGIDVSGLNNYLTKCNEMASSGKQLFDVTTLWERYKEGSKAIDDLKAAMTVSDAEKKSFTIDGKEESCKGYNVTITKDALIQFMTTSKDFFMNDETLKKDFIEYMSLMLEMQGTMAMYSDMEDKTPEQLQEEAWTEVGTQADTIISQLKESMGDLNMVVYARKDGKMASFDYNTAAKIDEEDIKIYGTVTFAGGYNMMANVNAAMTLEDTAGDTIVLTVDKTGAYEKGKSLNGTLSMSAESGGEEYKLNSLADYTVESGVYNVEVSAEGNGTKLGKLTSTGMVENLVKGTEFEVHIDSIKVEADFIGAGQYVVLSGFYRAAPLTSTIELPEGESFDIMAASEEDWNAVGAEIVGNAYGLLMGLSQ